MSDSLDPRRWRGMLRAVAGAGGAAGLAVIAGSASGGSGDETPIVRIEEDWRMTLNEPDQDVCSPQFHTVMSPFSHVEGLYFQTTWNYRELPEFSSGGAQLQVWNGENDFASRDVGDSDLSHDAETVSWTSYISTNGSLVEFGIENGFSSSWGGFGGDSMRVRTGRAIHSFPYYSTSVSASNSWVTYGTNRVVSLEITAVRYYDGNGNLVRTDSTPFVIASLPNEDAIPSEEVDD